MDLNKVLERTKNDSGVKKNIQITDAVIANDDRPYRDVVTSIDVDKSEDHVDLIECKYEKDVSNNRKDSVKDKPNSESICDEFFVLKMVGFEKKVLEYFFNLARNGGTMKVGPISRDTIVSDVGINVNTLKSILLGLKKNGVLKTVLSKRGKGGFSTYEIDKEIYRDLVAKGKPIASEPAVSVVDSNNSASVSEVTPLKNSLPPVWGRLEYEYLAENGFTKNHLMQIYQDQVNRNGDVLDLDAMQYSIDAFSFDLKNNKDVLKGKIYNKSPIVFFVQMLSKGRPYNSITPDIFKTPAQQEFQLYKESKAKIQLEYSKLKDEFYDTEYQSWYESLTSDNFNEIYSKQNVFTDNLSSTVQAVLKNSACREFFDKYIWADIQSNLMARCKF